jgi:hypothetical protein
VLALWLAGARHAGRAAAAVLAACWAWVAWAYLLQRYETINWAASYYAVAFAIEALLLLWAGLVRDRLALRPPAEATGWAGLGLFIFALLAYPPIAPLLGRSWTQAEIFGVAPDPTAVATLGLLLAGTRIRWHLLAIPLLWCAISAATLWAMQSPEAWVMGAVAAAALFFAGWKRYDRGTHEGRAS